VRVSRGLTKFAALTFASSLVIGLTGYAYGAPKLGTSRISQNSLLVLANWHHSHPATSTTARPNSTVPGSTTSDRSTTTTGAPGTTTSLAGTTTTAQAITTTAAGPTTTLAGPTTTVPAPTTTVPAATTTIAASSAYPIGVSDSSEPSGMAPPTASALAGYTQNYVSDFKGSSLPAGWDVYTGTPGGDPGGQFGAAHVTVSGGLLQLNTWQDPAYGNGWVTGGLCQCGHAQTYGAYFVRSRQTGAGPTAVMLLWPSAPVWPPEIDFNETAGGVSSTSATVHFGSSNSQIQRKFSIDMTQWHTWGVIWTPTTVTYTVDGTVWGSVTTASAIPSQGMTLDLQQQTWCSSGWACPSAPQSLQVDWVSEYTAS
jgi:hypothetical protein